MPECRTAGEKLVRHRHFFRQSASSVQHRYSGIRVPSGTAGHGLVRHCPALSICTYSEIILCDVDLNLLLSFRLFTEIQMCRGRARTSILQITKQILYQCATVSFIQISKFKTIFSTWRPRSFFTFSLLLAPMHADEGVSSVVGPPVIGVHDLALVHDVAGTHAC
jgi:hypothetical protein